MMSGRRRRPEMVRGLSDSTRRAVRTVLDVLPGVLAALIVLVPVLDLPAETVAKVGAVVAAVTVASAKFRNVLEDAGVIPALLKEPAAKDARRSGGSAPILELDEDPPARGVGVIAAHPPVEPTKAAASLNPPTGSRNSPPQRTLRVEVVGLRLDHGEIERALDRALERYARRNVLMEGRR